ncbi:uncharacterized protein LACBIDRAFT_313428 [Laccaria bicolor S238N-H82]|uniref:Predicted protein n=1 Tax=Laccaria bicolor (strain S238N-H82 / ATCC MYA-4686) TaxID=486041 RepID=B0D010_LACBS|nr:uncharacterized protein LACBIDRAFT_313428 [Laccaria bicolor S238N-H82]EDR11378.1 predicted protein [Laccaria bicolor S238N-H82]|eukprot:XP_001877275.1 predicted protein [Laccaria bicolor S238N-H82]
MDLYCWCLCKAEVCLGIACKDQEFILADCCFGSLDERIHELTVFLSTCRGRFDSVVAFIRECRDLFFPRLLNPCSLHPQHRRQTSISEMP